MFPDSLYREQKQKPILNRLKRNPEHSDRLIAHAAHPVLRWMASNVSIETDAADNWKPSKKKSIERIDGIVALIMAVDRATTQPPPYHNVYETRRVLTV